MILMALLAVATSIMVSYLASRTSAGVARDLRAAVFEKVSRFSSAEFNNFTTATLITRTTNDVSQVQQVIFMVIRMAFTAPMIGIGGVIRAIDKSPNMWWLIALAVFILLLFIMLAFAGAAQVQGHAVPGRPSEPGYPRNLSGLMVVRAFNKQSYEEQRFDKANQEVTGTIRFIGRVMTAMFPSSTWLTGLSVAIICWRAKWCLDVAGRHDRFHAIFRPNHVSLHEPPCCSSSFPRNFWRPHRGCARNANPDPGSRRRKQLPEPVQGKVEFLDVDFRYPGAEMDILHDISFTALPGQVTTLIGSTGAENPRW